MAKKKINLAVLGVATLMIGVLIGFSVMTIINESKPQELGTIYLMPSELGSAIALKEETGANVVVVGLLGETTENMILKRNVQDIVNSEDII